MNNTKDPGGEFLRILADVVNENLTNRQFGVSMLARKMGMSRANLHRKVNGIAKISVSQFIRQERLKRARTILRTSSDTVSEVAYEVGFNNVSYFIKCFHEYYGYSPGEVGQRDENESDPVHEANINKKRLAKILIAVFSVIVLALALLIIFKPFIFKRSALERTLAVLPPYYEPQDSAYCKPVNGAVQNVIDNLNNIRDITVRPWLSVLQYKNSDKAAPEIASELKVNYIVKPSILTYNDRIQLNIAMIEGKKNIQLWMHTFDIDINDLTNLYQVITKDIAMHMNAKITPEEKYKIEKPITKSGKALNYYNEGVDFIDLYHLYSARNNIDSAIIRFENALKFDSTCASAYAQIARLYFSLYLPGLRAGREPTKSHSEQIYKLTAKANLYDPELDLTLIAHSFYNWLNRDYDLAIEYFNKALEYNPKSYLATYYLWFIYTDFKEEPEKILETAFNIVNSDLLLKDNPGDVRLGHIYKTIAHAYAQLGLKEKALEYAEKLIVANPELPDGINTKTRILANFSGDYSQSITLLLESVDKGLTNCYTYRQLGLFYYLMRDYPRAAVYYKKLLEQEEQGLTSRFIISLDAWHIALVLLNTGENEKAQQLIREEFEHPYFQDPRLRSWSLIGYYALKGDTANAMEQMRIFSRYKKMDLVSILWFKEAPVYDTLRNIPEYKQFVSELEARLREKQELAKKSLQAKGLL